MKTMKLLFTLLFIAAFATVGFGQNIVGSAHDFSADAWNSSGEICIACHTPHNASTTVNTALWNHDETVATFTLYSSSTLDATDVGQPTGVSKLCLSCHDGTVALDSYGGATGTTFMGTVNSDATFGIDLSNDHPIGFTYDVALAAADDGLFNPTTTASGLGAEIDDDMLFGATNDQMECSSCHDVHDAENNVSLLRKVNSASALCLTCHNK